MNLSLILFGLLPLIAFVVIDSFLGLKAGIISAVVLALAETAYSIYELGSIDELTLASLALVLVFAFLSLKFKTPLFMKLQPVFLGICFGVILLVMQAIGKPMMVMAAEKYGSMLPQEYQANLDHPLVKTMLAKLSLVLGFGFLIHAGAVLYAALRMSNWWWLFIRGIGLYAMMFACMIITRFL